MTAKQFKWFKAVFLTAGWIALAFAPSRWWRMLPVYFFVLPQFFDPARPLEEKLPPAKRYLVYGAVLLIFSSLFWLGSYFDQIFGRGNIETVIRSVWFVAPCWILSMYWILSNPSRDASA